MKKATITFIFLSITALSFSQETIQTIDPGPAYAEKEDLKIYERKEVEVPSRFKDGEEKMNQFVNENFVLSKKAIEKKINGEIIISFVVEKDGTLTSFKTIKDLGQNTNKELERVAKLGTWYPAELNGKKVRSTFKLTHTINKQ